MNNRIIKNYQQHNKIIGMVIFLIMDIALNSVLDYDKINDHIANNIKLGIFGLQVVIQISIFLILFLATADTFLFRVGLINILIQMGCNCENNYKKTIFKYIIHEFY